MRIVKKRTVARDPAINFGDVISIRGWDGYYMICNPGDGNVVLMSLQHGNRLTDTYKNTSMYSRREAIDKMVDFAHWHVVDAEAHII